MVDKIVEQRRMQYRRRIELFACNSRANDSEDARANNRANTQRSERYRAERLLQAVLRVLRIADELVD